MLVLGALTASPLQQNMQYQNVTKFAKKKKKKTSQNTGVIAYL